MERRLTAGAPKREDTTTERLMQEFEQRIVAREHHFVYRELRIKLQVSGAHFHGKALYVGFGSRVPEESFGRLQVYSLLYALVAAVHNERCGRGRAYGVLINFPLPLLGGIGGIGRRARTGESARPDAALKNPVGI